MVTTIWRSLLCVLLCTLASIVLSGVALAEEVIEDIEVHNSQRIDTDLVFSNLPFTIGDPFDSSQIAEAIRKLYATGYFDDINISREANTVIISVSERPTIRSIELEGNKLISEKDLLETLSRNNIAAGEVLRRNTLDQIITELEQVYGSQGRYGTVIDLQTEDAGDNVVNLVINITEAPPALIATINIIGNHTFDDSELIADFESSQRDFWTSFFSWAVDINSYARSRLAGDLQRLRDFYFERGYVDFKIRSTDVSISNDYKNIYVTISVEEGEQYRVGTVRFSGDLIVDLESYTDKVTLQSKDVYLASSATKTELSSKQMLENLGYGFAEITLQLDLDKPTRTVDLTYLVNPGKRLYVRRIHFSGNTSTTEETLRREIRIFEGGWFSNAKIQESEARLKRLGLFAKVNHEIQRIPGINDQIDILFTLEDMPTGSFNASLTYGNLQGLGLGFKIKEQNIAGSGNSGSIGIEASSQVQQLQVDWNRPYTNFDGASLSTGLNYYKVNYKNSEIANFATSSYSLEASLGYPVGDTWRFNYGFSYSVQEVQLGEQPIVEIEQFTKRYGSTVQVPALEVRLAQNSFDTGFLPTRGIEQNIGLFSTFGTQKLHFYRLDYSNRFFQPLDTHRKWIYRPSVRLSYSRSYQDNLPSPFLYNSYAGGYGTVRGYAAGSLGPRATDADGEAGAIGGNILLQSSQELIFPLWFPTERVRFSLFYDIGNVFTENCVTPDVPWCIEGVDTNNLRSSYGVTVAWYTLVGPLVFIVPRAINPKKGDSTNSFEFSLGRVF